MDFFAILGIALGLAMLAGINLYLTIFLTGLAVSLEKIPDAALAAALEGFGHPAVMAVALGLFVAQFIVDKIPWADSLWDSIHTFLKPAGGVLLALTALGPEAGGFMQFLVAVIAFVGSLLTHWVKAGTRLSINTSPEPFSNIGASVMEDLLVIGGGLLVLYHPAISFFVFAVILGFFVYLTPRVTRSIRAILWLIWKKVRVPASDRSAGKQELPQKLKPDAEMLLLGEFGNEDYAVAWCIHCVAGKTSHSGRLCRNVSGELIAIRERPGRLYFVGRRDFKKFVEPIDLRDARVAHESNFLSEAIVIANKQERSRVELLLHRGQEARAERICDDIREKIEESNRREPEGAAGDVRGEPEKTAPPLPEIETEVVDETQRDS